MCQLVVRWVGEAVKDGTYLELTVYLGWSGVGLVGHVVVPIEKDWCWLL
jgi:hypothetical protein